MFLNRIMKIQIDIYEEINIYVCTEIKKNRIVEIKKRSTSMGGCFFSSFSGKHFAFQLDGCCLSLQEASLNASVVKSKAKIRKASI